MKALVKVNYEGLVQLKDIEEPAVGEDEVKIEISVAGICGTDLHILMNEYKHRVPVVMGHEFSGVVVAVGRKVTNVSVHDRVVSLTAAVTCGTCNYCIAGLPMLCSQRLSIGSGVNGAFAKYLVIDSRLVRKIPDSISMDAAALTEPLACVVHGLMEMSRIKAGDVVFVSGPGAIGLLAVQVAHAEGGTVIVCGTAGDKDRLEIAGKLGAAAIIDLDKEDCVEKLREITGENGADVAVECAGVAVSSENCLQVLKKRGRYHQMGLFGKPITIDLDMLAYKEVIYSSSFATTPSSYRTALRLMELGLVRTEPLISARLPLDHWEDGFLMMKNKTGLKVLLYPD